jgi:hypothetical protein
MDWIKKNYDRFILALFAVALIGVAVMLFLSAQKFGDKFAEAMSSPPKSTKVPEVDMARVAEAKKSFETPSAWEPDTTIHGGRLFTSEQYYVENGKLVKPEGGTLYVHSRTGDPIPNLFFTKNNLPLLDPKVPFGDQDGDGFNNEDEWYNGGKGVVKEGVKSESTNPLKKDNHPPYYTVLQLKTWIKVPFRLRFNSYDGNPATDPVEKMTFQINTLDLRQPTEFLKIGDTVANTKFKLKAFKFKEEPNPSTGVTADVSELILVNTETEEEVALILNKVVDSPNQFADFAYRWNKKQGEADQIIRVPKLKEFVLQPEVTVRYKLLDVNQENAVIQAPDGQKITVPLLKK